MNLSEKRLGEIADGLIDLLAEVGRLREIEEAARLAAVAYPLPQEGEPVSDCDYYIRQLLSALAEVSA